MSNQERNVSKTPGAILFPVGISPSEWLAFANTLTVKSLFPESASTFRMLLAVSDASVSASISPNTPRTGHLTLLSAGKGLKESMWFQSQRICSMEVNSPLNQENTHGFLSRRAFSRSLRHTS